MRFVPTCLEVKVTLNLRLVYFLSRLCIFLHSQWTLILATGLAAISTFAIVACSVQLQNTFGASAAAVEAWDVTKTLKAKMLTAYGYLVRFSQNNLIASSSTLNNC